MEIVYISAGVLVFGACIFWLRWEAVRTSKRRAAAAEARRHKLPGRDQVEFVTDALPQAMSDAVLTALDLPRTAPTTGGPYIAAGNADDGVAVIDVAPAGADRAPRVQRSRSVVRWGHSDSGRLVGTFAHLQVCDPDGVPADPQTLLALQEAVVRAIRAADPEARIVVDTVPPSSASPGAANGTVPGLERALERALDPMAPAAELAELAYHVPQARALVAANPAIHPALVPWLAALADPGVDRALAERG